MMQFVKKYGRKGIQKKQKCIARGELIEEEQSVSYAFEGGKAGYFLIISGREKITKVELLKSKDGSYDDENRDHWRDGAVFVFYE